MEHRRISWCLAGLIALAMPFTAAAQSGVDWGGMMGTIAQGDATMEAARAPAPQIRRAPAPVPRAQVASLAYQPSIERRKANLAKIVAHTERLDAKGAAELERLFASGDVVAKMQNAVSRYGIRTDNLADAYAMWWIDSWQAAHNRNTPFNARQFAAVRAQAARAMLAVPDIARGGDATKQQLAEGHLIQAFIIESMMGLAERNPAFRATMARAVRQGARASGVDLDAMRLTEAGFVPA